MKCREVNDSPRDTLQTGGLRVESRHASLPRRTRWSTWRCSPQVRPICLFGLRPLEYPHSRLRSLGGKKSVWGENLRKQRRQAGTGGRGARGERGMQRRLSPLLHLRSFSVRPPAVPAVDTRGSQSRPRAAGAKYHDSLRCVRTEPAPTAGTSATEARGA